MGQGRFTPQGCLNILIVEDDPIMAMMLQELIEHEGHIVCGVASDSRSSWGVINTFRPDVVFMDLLLDNNESGLDLTKDITRKLGLPVIVISGSSEDDVLEGVVESGALSFIQKPVHIMALRINLHLAMRQHYGEKRLAESMERYKAIYNNAAVGIYVCGADGKYFTCNKAFASILGYSSPHELITTLLFQDEQLYDEPDRRKKLLAQLLEEHEVSNFESKVYGRDGDMIWISEHCTGLFDEDGSLAQYEGVVLDITARKEAEYAFRTTYNLIKTTIDSLGEGILVTDLEGHLVMCNRAAADIFEPPLEEGAKPAFLDTAAEGGPFKLFRETLISQSGVISIVPGQPPFHCGIEPYKNAMDVVIGAVHVLRKA